MTKCWGIPVYPVHYLLTLLLMGLCPSVETIMLNSMAHLLAGRVCYQWNWRVILTRHCHYYSSMMVSRMRWSWIIPRNSSAAIFVRSCVRLTTIRRLLNLTHLGAQPLRCGCSLKMIKTQSPKRLWEHCAELEARIHSCTVHDHYLLDGEVPETVIKGHTEDISTIREYEWYE